MREDSRFMYVIKRIWPFIYKMLNSAIYFVIMLVREMVKMAIDQIRNF